MANLLKWMEILEIRHPRTMIGIKENKDVVLVVVDGRKPEQGSYGVNGAEMAEIMKCFNCVQAYNFDGGGSSALFVKNEKKNLN
jgi:exopolysaccharide biosynthesis protein